MGIVAQTAADQLPAWIGTAVSVPFLAGLWWTERKARMEAEQRERSVLTSSAEKVHDALQILDRATALVDARKA